LADHRHSPSEARALFQHLLGEVVKMLHAGVVHGDLSDFNVLLGPDGPVIIDFPQAIDAARNTNAKRLLLRDVANLTRFFGRFAPELRRSEYGQEMWLLHEQGALRPDSRLTGRFAAARTAVDAQVVLREIEAAKRDAAKRAEIEAARAAARAARPPQPSRR
jgi:RIO kinase 1